MRACAAWRRPLFDHTGFANYSLSLAGPRSRLSAAELTEIGVDLKQTCERISGDTRRSPNLTAR